MARTLHDRIGGHDACLSLATAFYARLDQDSVLLAAYRSRPGASHRCAIESLTEYVEELAGGPPEHSLHSPFPSLIESHLRFRIGAAERDAWLRTMSLALAETVRDNEARAELGHFFETATRYLINSPVVGPGQPESDQQVQSGKSPLWEIPALREEVLTASRAGDFERTVALIGTEPLRTHFGGNRPAFARLLGAIGSGEDDRFLAWIETVIVADPALATTEYSRGWTLAHSAALNSAPKFAELLIRRGGPVDSEDRAGHRPLYLAGNAAKDCPEIARLLISAGADVDAAGGVMRCTALHMAARRGHTGVATVLLDSGANIEARGSKGVTPLGRAVNCRKRKVADLLIARGALTEED